MLSISRKLAGTLGLEKVKKVRMRDVFGRWRIIEMEQWDQEYVDELGPGFLKLERAGTGSLQFGVVQAGVDYRMEERTGNPVLEFSFEGFAEMDRICGRQRKDNEGSYLYSSGRRLFVRRPTPLKAMPWVIRGLQT